VLATSREVLGVPGEVVFTVPPLSLPPDDEADVAELARSDAVALFCERARTARPGFELSEANAAAVARICRRLDGIPLGLELAAGKIRVLGADQIAERLDHRFRLLTDGARTAVPRHRTLSAAMDWSYSLLPPPERAVLRRLSVFRGTFSLDAAEAVGFGQPTFGAGLEVLGLLTRLVDKSMLFVVDDGREARYGLLETIREYAGHKLVEAGEADQARTRHRDHFLGLADTWAAASDYWNWWLWLRRLVADRDDFTAALEWSLERGDDDALLHLAAAHWPYWYWGETLGWRVWLVEAVERCPTPGPARVEALVALASLLKRTGEEPARCETLFAEARHVALGLPGGQSVAQVDFYRAHVLLSDGQRRAAEGLLRGALGRSTNADFLGWCRWALGWIALLDDDVDAAAAEFDASLVLGDGVDDESLRAHVCSALALVAALRGDGDTAGSMAARAVRSADRMVGAPRVLMMALAHAGQAAVLSGDRGAAAPATRLLRMLRDMGVTYWADEALDVTGLVLVGRLPEEAAAALCAARQIGEGDGRLRAMRDHLVRCRARLVEILGAGGWAAAAHRAREMPVNEAIGRALAALETHPADRACRSTEP
jgi:predicted ATPase